MYALIRVFLFVSLAAFLSLAGSDLDELRSFLDKPLPLQGGEGRVVTWWNVSAMLVGSGRSIGGAVAFNTRTAAAPRSNA